ncbi:MAG: hypothetical protein K8S55_06560 [Phycisphaerae bacterium]|nr:hypothetical protein [Phycisphaerae bacterium]
MNEFSPKPDVFIAPKFPPAPRGLRIFVIVASVVTGFSVGLTTIPDFFAESVSIVGGIGGALGGFVSACFWLAMMQRFVERPFRSSLLRIIAGISCGTIAGVIGGSIAAEILWCIHAIHEASLDTLIIGQMDVISLGAPAGAVIGLICACLWLAVIQIKFPPEENTNE